MQSKEWVRLEVEAIESQEEEFELRSWVVRTRQGALRFQTKLEAWPALDERSRAIRWAFID
jgi:hypothetical protein